MINKKIDYEFQDSDNNFTFLSMIFLSIMMGTYLLAYKLIAIGPFIESAGIFIFPLNYAITDIITEVYGYKKTVNLIKYSFICCFLFATIVPFLALLPGPQNWEHQINYIFIFSHVFRFFIANSIGIIVGICINGYLISKWGILFNGGYFWLRSIGASAVGELITSIIADLIAFIGTTNFTDVVKLMLSIYIVKLIYAVILAWPNTLLVLHLKLKEKKVQNFINYKPSNNNNITEEKNVTTILDFRS